MNTVKLGVQEIADRIGIDKPDAYNLVRGLCAMGVARRAGSARLNGNAKGKASILYELTEDLLTILVNAKSHFGFEPALDDDVEPVTVPASNVAVASAGDTNGIANGEPADYLGDDDDDTDDGADDDQEAAS
jgi:hypothetical protein